MDQDFYFHSSDTFNDFCPRSPFLCVWSFLQVDIRGLFPHDSVSLLWPPLWRIFFRSSIWIFMILLYWVSSLSYYYLSPFFCSVWYFLIGWNADTYMSNIFIILYLRSVVFPIWGSFLLTGFTSFLFLKISWFYSLLTFIMIT